MKRAGSVVANAVLCGTVSEIGGGKFANGAVTGAFAMMFNDMMHQKNDAKNMESYRKRVKREIEADGKLSYMEALTWWQIGNGETLEVDVNSLNLDFVDISDKGIGEKWYFSVRPGGFQQWGVYGTVTAAYLGNNTIVLFPDKYDFDIKSNPKNDSRVTKRNTWTRIGRAIHGEGTPYSIVFKGIYKVK